MGVLVEYLTEKCIVFCNASSPEPVMCGREFVCVDA